MTQVPYSTTIGSVMYVMVCMKVDIAYLISLVSQYIKVHETTSIYEACCQMAAQRANVIALTDSNALLTGILKIKDIINRVIACEINLVSTTVLEVMTKNLKCLLSDTPVTEAQEAQKKLLEGQVQQFPVIANGKIIGFFDRNRKNLPPYYLNMSFDIISRGATAKQLPLEHALTVPETTTIYEACSWMNAGKVEAVVLTDSNALWKGVLTKKDIVSRVIPSGIDFMSTPVSEVVAKNPMYVCCDTFPVETLQEIVQAKYMELLVIENDEDNGLVYRPMYDWF